MRRILLTGISGTGKSTVVAELAARGYKALDADDGLCRTAADGEWLWNEDLVDQVLSTEDTDVLVLAGAASNQVRFYDRFDHIILLSTPVGVIVERLATRTTNPFGKAPDELDRVLDYHRTVEPMLRRISTHEIVTTRPLPDIVDEIVRFVGGPS